MYEELSGGGSYSGGLMGDGMGDGMGGEDGTLEEYAEMERKEVYEGWREVQRISWEMVHPAIVGACEDALAVSGCECDMDAGIDSYLAEYLVMDGEEYVGSVSDPDLIAPDSSTNATNASTQPLSSSSSSSLSS